jgi:hypothetical protein
MKVCHKGSPKPCRGGALCTKWRHAGRSKWSETLYGQHHPGIVRNAGTPAPRLTQSSYSVHSFFARQDAARTPPLFGPMLATLRTASTGHSNAGTPVFAGDNRAGMRAFPAWAQSRHAVAPRNAARFARSSGLPRPVARGNYFAFSLRKSATLVAVKLEGDDPNRAVM